MDDGAGRIFGTDSRGAAGGFSSYTSLLDDNGTLHCLINRPEFYTLAVGGVSFVAWLDACDAPPASQPSELPLELPPELPPEPLSQPG